MARLLGNLLICLACLLATSPLHAAGERGSPADPAFTQWSKWIVGRDVDRRRQAAEGLGGYPEQRQAVDLLAGALGDRDTRVRRLAAGSLWRLADRGADIRSASPDLRRLLDDPSPGVRVQAAGALEKAGTPSTDLVAVRRGLLVEGNWFEIALAIRGLLGDVDGGELVAPLLASLRDTPPLQDRDAFHAGRLVAPLLRRGGSGVVAALVEALDEPGLRKTDLLAALSDLDPPPEGWVQTLQRVALDADPEARAAALDALRKRVATREAERTWIPRLLGLLDDPYPEVRRAAAALYGAAGAEGHPALEGLLALAGAEQPEAVRRAALSALGRLGDAAEAFDREIKADIARRARPVLEAAASAAEAGIRDEARSALKALDEGSAVGTRVLQSSGDADDDAMQRLRDRGVPFTEDAFWRAIGERQHEVVADLLAAGLSPRDISADGMPPLHFVVATACDYGQPTAEATQQMVASLLRHGADPNQREQPGDNTALHRATLCDAKLVRQLVAAKVDMRARNASGSSAFAVFVLTSPEGARALLEAGYRAPAAEQPMLRAMLAAERDPTRRKLLERALGRDFDVE